MTLNSQFYCKMLTVKQYLEKFLAMTQVCVRANAKTSCSNVKIVSFVIDPVLLFLCGSSTLP